MTYRKNKLRKNRYYLDKFLASKKIVFSFPLPEDKHLMLKSQDNKYGFNELDVMYLNIELKKELYEKLNFYIDFYGIPEVEEVFEYNGVEKSFDDLLYEIIGELELFLSIHMAEQRELKSCNSGEIWNKCALILPYLRVDNH